jgi:hypothetical protein
MPPAFIYQGENSVAVNTPCLVVHVTALPWRRAFAAATAVLKLAARAGELIASNRKKYIAKRFMRDLTVPSS